MNLVEVFFQKKRICVEIWPGKSPEIQKGTEKTVAPKNLETMVMPPEVSTTNQTSQTDAGVQGNLLREYEQKFADLPEHVQMTKLCSNAGLAKTVEKVQYFMTLDDEELEILKGSCREYTLPRSDQSSQLKGWICSRHTKIGSVLDVRVFVIFKDVTELKS